MTTACVSAKPAVVDPQLAASLQHYWETWPKRPCVKPTLIRELTDGNSHRSFLLRAGSELLVIKILDPRIEALLPPAAAFNLKPDQQPLLQRLSQAELCPPLLWCSSNLQITAYIEANHWPDNADDNSISQLARTLATLHQQPVSPALAGSIDMAIHLQGYEQLLLSRAIDSSSLDSARRAVSESLLWLQSQPERRVLCHQDLHPGNLLLSPTGIYLLDWEYASYNDPHMDLAAICEHFALSEQQLNRFFQIYTCTRLSPPSSQPAEVPRRSIEPRLSVDPQRLFHFRRLLRYTECLWWLLKDPDCGTLLINPLAPINSLAPTTPATHPMQSAFTALSRLL